MHKLAGPAMRVRVYIGESDHHRGRPLYQAMVLEARKAGLAGATVYRGIEGYGESSQVKQANLLDLSDDLPIVVEFVEHADKVAAVLPRLQAMIEGGLITTEEVSVVAPSDAPGRGA
jgi:uncharacterized protein